MVPCFALAPQKSISNSLNRLSGLSHSHKKSKRSEGQVVIIFPIAGVAGLCRLTAETSSTIAHYTVSIELPTQQRIVSFYVHYSTLLHLPPLKFHCVGGCWDRTQDCCDIGIDALTTWLNLIHSRIDLIHVRIDLIHDSDRSHPRPG